MSDHNDWDHASVEFARPAYPGETKVICKCGAEWTHPASHDKAKRIEIFNAHVAYFTHKKMETL